jgi:hypothetical protein
MQFLYENCVSDQHIRKKPEILYFTMLEDAVQAQKVKSRNRCTQVHVMLNFRYFFTGGKTMNNLSGHQELPYRYFVYLPTVQAA